MKQLTFKELCEKEVINTCDCRRLGYVFDLSADMECGRILSLSVRGCGSFLPTKGEELCIPWECIEKIGDDLIFVNINHTPPPPPAPKKRLFG